MSDEAKKYLQDVALAFPIAAKDEKRFLNDMMDPVYTFAEEHPGCGQQEFYAEFGNPKEVILDYYQETSMDVYMGMMKRSKNIRQMKTAVIAALVVALVIVTGFCIYSTQRYKNATTDDIRIDIQEQIEKEDAE